jgi:hypothetical protein
MAKTIRPDRFIFEGIPMITRRKMWQMLSSLPLIAAVANRAAARPPDASPPSPSGGPGMEMLSWYVMMGIGQVVTLKFAAEKLRDINALIEREAWGGYRTEFYATYDYRALYKQEQSKNS